MQDIANQLEIEEFKDYKKLDLIYQILDKQALKPIGAEKTTNRKPKTKTNNPRTRTTHKENKDIDEKNKPFIRF